MYSKNKKIKKIKGLSYWFFALSLLILALATAWMGYLGQQTLDFTKENASIAIKNPLFTDYLLELGVEHSTKVIPTNPVANNELPKTIPLGNPIAAAKEKLIQTEKSNLNTQESSEETLLKIFSNLRGFENKRAETILRKVNPTVAHVQKGSLAEGWGFKSGDQIKMIGVEPINSVWDFYQLVDTTTAQQLSFSIARGKKQLQITSTDGKENFSVNQIGILFVIPDGLSYISKSDGVSLANQFDEQFVKVVGESLKKDYVSSLNTFISGLMSMGFNQNFDLDKYEKINTTGMLTWHHEKYLNQMDAFHGKLRSNISNQETVMKAFQQALLGFAAAFILCISAFLIRLRFLSNQNLES